MTAELYDPATNRFSAAGSMPGEVPGGATTASVLRSGKVLFAGGPLLFQRLPPSGI